MQTKHYETDLDNWKGIAGYEQFSRYFSTLKRFSDHCDRERPLEELVDAPDWVPSIVAHALRLLAEVDPHYAN